MNRLSGLADEMGSFFNKLKKLELEYLKQIECNNTFERMEEKEKTDVNTFVVNTKIAQGEAEDNELMSVCTPYDCLNHIFNE